MTATELPPIVVTGAASGIGAALVELLAADGRAVIGLDREDGENTLGCDLGDPDSIAAAAARLPARLGGLANVAGVPGTAPPLTVLRVNALGPSVLTRTLVPRIVAPAAVVNVASVAAHRNTQPAVALAALRAATGVADVKRWLERHPLDGPAAYDTSKQLLVDSTRLCAAELIGTGIRCLSVSPGPVDTPILKDFATSMGQESMDRSIATVGRHGTAGEVAAVVAFALSPAAGWLNGIDILVEGGLMAARAAASLRDGG